MIKKIILILIILAVSVFFFRNHIAQISIKNGLKSFLDEEISIQEVEVSPSFLRYRIQGVTIYESREFGGGVLAEIPDIAARISIWEYLKTGRLWIAALYIDLKEIKIIRNNNGVLNISRFENIKGSPDKKSRIHIEELIASIGRVTFQDITGAPVVVDLNIKGQVFRNIDDLDDVVKVLITRIFYSKAFGATGSKLVVAFEPTGKELMKAMKLAEFSQITPEQIASAYYSENAQEFITGTAKETGNLVQKGATSLWGFGENMVNSIKSELSKQKIDEDQITQ